MADDKKTNLPTVIKNLPSTEVSRRDFLRGLSGTVAQGVLDTIPTGRLIDLVTKNDKPFVSEGKIIRDLALLTKEIQSTMAEFNSSPAVQDLSKKTLGLLLRVDKPDNWYDTDQYTYIRRNHLLVNPEAYSKEIEGLQEGVGINFYEGGSYYESLTDPSAGLNHQEFGHFLNEIQEEIEPLEKEYANKLQELKEVITDKYGEEAAKGIFEIDQPEHLWPRETIATILDDAVDGLEVKDMYPDEDDSEGWEKIHRGGSYEENRDAALSIIMDSDHATIQDKMDHVAKEIIDEIEWEASGAGEIKSRKLAQKGKKEISVKDLGTTVGTELLQRTLTNLALPKKPKDKKEIKAPEQKQKQIQSSKTDSSQMNKLLTALSMFKKASPLGAAAAMFRPKPAGVDSDIVE
jgi:hypothetical protein